MEYCKYEDIKTPIGEYFIEDYYIDNHTIVLILKSHDGKQFVISKPVK